MRRSLTDDEFDSTIFGAQRYAWRWEQQPAYEIGYETTQLEAFLAGQPQIPTDNPDMVDYLGRVRQMYFGEHRNIGRVRVVEEPPTDYQRWLRWMDQWNRAAGEDIHYLSRTVLKQMGPPPFEPDADWWLVDGEKLLIMRFAQDGSGRRLGVEMVTDEPVIKLARLWRLAVISWAAEEESSLLPAAA
jgi:hypothetical protein